MRTSTQTRVTAQWAHSILPACVLKALRNVRGYVQVSGGAILHYTGKHYVLRMYSHPLPFVGNCYCAEAVA